ncbi:MAG: lipid A export permease/ATP-binding protein MsbA [Gammaproteobacteria bacterium]|nr:lipid A export permease/ATP-binding protein MsbA [Gammaproteobacteria bacterium]
MSSQSTVPPTATATYKRLLSYVRPYWRVFIIAILAMAVMAASEGGFAAIMKPLLDEGFVQREAAVIKWMPIVIISIFLIRGLASFLSTYCMQWVGRRVIKQLRHEVFDHLLFLPSSYYDRNSTGVLVSKLTYNIEQVAEATTKAITILISDSLKVIVLLSWMFYLNALLSVFILVAGPVLAVIVRLVSKHFRRYSSRIQTTMGDVTRVAEEIVSGHRVVKIFGAQEYERKRFGKINERNRRLHMKLAAIKAGSVPVVQVIAAFGIAAVVYVATMDEMLSVITPGIFVSFLGAMLLMTPPLKHLTDINEPLQKGIAAAESIFKLLDEAGESDGGQSGLQRARGDIEYRDVRFTYSADKGEVIKGVSFSISAGQTIAFVGRSGSGKTTIANLLPRFYELDNGEILVDGRNTKEYRRADLRNQIALVSQDVVLFNDTIANNIAYGSLRDVSKEEIEKAAQAAQAMEFIKKLPNGLDAVVGDRGVLLSGGQRQRIAIARALLKDAPILILDEATSALDTESERAIQAGLEVLMKNRTTLVIAHRLSTVENADKIVVLDHGTVAETGSHAELMARGNIYSALYQMQFEDVKESEAARV